MDENERFRLLFGPYAAPQFEYGQIMHCELHGDVIACGMSAGPIPWPIGKYSERGNTRFFILTGDLVRAVRQEAAIVVCHWWGVKQCCVTRWRKALGVGLSNEGTHLLRHKYSHEPGVRRGLEKAIQARKRAAASRRSGN